jgi:hypothetical protein
LENHRSVLIVYLQPFLPVFLSAPVTLPLRRPFPRPSKSRRRHPSSHARRQAYQSLLRARHASPGLKACPGVPLNFFYPFHRAALPFFPSSTRVLLPELRRCLSSPLSAASAASHPRSSAPVAPPPHTDAHRPAEFHSPALEQPDHRAGEIKLRRRSVSPSSRRSVTSQPPPSAPPAPHHPRGSVLATSPPPSSTPATGTPSPPLGAPLPAPIRHRLAVSAPLFPNTGHPRERRELLNLFPHFPLATGEPPRRNFVAVDRLLYLTRPRTQLQGFKSF